MSKIGAIIIVDDDELGNTLNSMVIEELSVTKEIRTFISPLEALEFLKAKGFDNIETPELIIVDLNMPEMSGEEFVIKFFQTPFLNRNRISIIIYSAILPAKKYDYLKSLGVQDFIEKPLTDAKILQLLTRIGIDV